MIKHITIINQYIGSPYHGMEYRHYYLAKELIKKGFKVTLVSGSYSHLFSTLPNIKGKFTKEIIDDIEYIWVKTPKYKSSKSIGRIWNMLSFAHSLRKIKLEPSHIIVSSPSLFPVKIGRKLANRFKTKFLFEVRDIWPLTLMELSNISDSNPLIAYMKIYERFAYREADYIISLLPTAKDYFIQEGMSSDKFVYLPNGIEVKPKKDIKLSKKVISQIPKDKFIIAYTGTVGIANNLDYLIDVANLLKSNNKIYFIILGQGGERKRLEDRVKELELNNFTFIDPISKDEVNSFLSYINVAFISLLPERLFRFGVSPNKVFDYMYASKSIIWAIGAGNNLVKEANCGVSVSTNNPQELKDIILKLNKLDKNELIKLGKNGYNFV
ncbi:MAG: glycosyltransferase family 4 protein, partial [Sulfurovaceae bacterium]|nr:glycosyltransferase family 4 protein [Sulfurovaceae bacterium]